MIDIVIPMGLGSRINNEEIRYCLRAVEKYLSNYGNVIIVGDIPEFLTNIIPLPCQENENNWWRAKNIYNKIMYAIFKEAISDNFLFMNDDHFLNDNYEAKSFPYYCRPFNIYKYTSNSPEWKQWQNTIELLTNRYGKQNGLLDFDIHCPIVYNKDKFIRAFDKVPDRWPEYGYCLKTIYSYYANPHTKPHLPDLKFIEPMKKERIKEALTYRTWFSTGDRCFRGDMLEVLKELYPTPSKYENDV